MRGHVTQIFRRVALLNFSLPSFSAKTSVYQPQGGNQGLVGISNINVYSPYRQNSLANHNAECHTRQSSFSFIAVPFIVLLRLDRIGGNAAERLPVESTSLSPTCHPHTSGITGWEFPIKHIAVRLLILRFNHTFLLHRWSSRIKNTT